MKYITILILLFIANPVFALELQYPNIFGLNPGSSLLTYVNYIFNFAVFSVGIIALGVLIFNGIKYLISSGEPEKIENAKKGIFSAILGLVILLCSYIILETINPNIKTINMPGVEQIPYTAEISPMKIKVNSDILKRITDLMEAIKTMSKETKEITDRINKLTDGCDCNRARSLCLCSGGDNNSFCEAKISYVGPGPQNDPNLCGGEYGQGDHPCPDSEEIKILQKAIVDRKDIALYYKNRVVAEVEDLKRNIDITLNDKISYYQKSLSVEKKAPMISSLKEELAKVEREKQYKLSVVRELSSMPDILLRTVSPSSQLSLLPDKCLSDVKDICIPKCIQSSMYGCHDRLCGCQPDKPEGGNPCPTKEIRNNKDELSPVLTNMSELCDKIISIITSANE